MSTAPVSVVPEQAPFTPSGEVLTRRAVTAVTAAVMVITFAFSLGNVTRLCLDLGITVWIAWLVGPAVDLSVIGLLVGMRFLSLHGYKDDELAGLRRMLRFCGLLTLALNTAGAIGHHQYGTALVDAVGPALLIGWSEVGPWLLHQIYAVCRATAPEPSAPQNPEAAQRATRGAPRQAAGPHPGAGRRAPRGDRQAHQPGRPPRPAADRPRSGRRPGRGCPRGGGRKDRAERSHSGSRLRQVTDARHALTRSYAHNPVDRAADKRRWQSPGQCREALVRRLSRGFPCNPSGISARYLTVISHGDIGSVALSP